MNETTPGQPSKPLSARLLVWIVLGLVAFNLVLFAKFVLASGATTPAQTQPAVAAPP